MLLIKALDKPILAAMSKYQQGISHKLWINYKLMDKPTLAAMSKYMK